VQNTGKIVFDNAPLRVYVIRVMNDMPKAGSEFVLNSVTCVVLNIETLRGEPHVAFYFQDDKGETRFGWLHVNFVQKLQLAAKPT